jgi:hypothetical protein
VITAEDLIATLGIPLAGAADQAWARDTAYAVNAYVDRLPHVTPDDWDAATRVGALMLAQRIYAARSAPLGAAGLDVTGALVRATTDPEVGRLLRTGKYMAPRVG